MLKKLKWFINVGGEYKHFISFHLHFSIQFNFFKTIFFSSCPEQKKMFGTKKIYLVLSEIDTNTYKIYFGLYWKIRSKVVPPQGTDIETGNIPKDDHTV